MRSCRLTTGSAQGAGDLRGYVGASFVAPRGGHTPNMASAPARARRVDNGRVGGSGAARQAAADTNPSMCSTSGIELKSLENFRDLAEGVPTMRTGCVLRSAKPVYLDEADARHLTETLGLQVLLDLRSAKELHEDPPDSRLLARAAYRPYRRTWMGTAVPVAIPLPHQPPPPQQQQQAQPSPCEGSNGGDGGGMALVRHNVSLVERLRYYSGLAWHLPWMTIAWALATLPFSREAARLSLVDHINAGGLPLMYKVILDTARPEIAAAMRVVLESAEARRPLLLYCSIGKDRTGIISALVLSCVGASLDQIVADYHRSDSQCKASIAGLDERPELRGIDLTMFEHAPVAAGVAMLEYIHQRYSSLPGYLTAAGFGPEEQARLRRALARDDAVRML
mmetsp:Transcript_19156/g.56934  ORF Transcript_19156/g.56934 Transcript_19156/m.56934 type:complete len:395 (-) Transcript_19156:296-1480(-)